MKVIVTLSGSFPDNLEQGDFDDLKEEIEDVSRHEYGASGVVVEVVRA